LQAAQLQAALAQLSHESGDASAARLREQAAEAREQTERLRAELGALQAQLSAQGVDGSGANNCTDATTDAEGRAVQPPSAGRRAPAVRIAAEDAQGTASPVNLARQSVVGCGEANPGPSGRPRDRMHGMTTLAEDELGQMTPIGAASAREPADRAAVALPRASIVAEGNTESAG
jgi:hypothetical protein